MRVRRISLRTMLLVMMVAVTLCTMLLFNAVYGNMTGEVFSQLDLRLINQNLARAKDRLDEALLGTQDLWDYVQDSVLLREDFAPGGFSAAVGAPAGRGGRPELHPPLQAHGHRGRGLGPERGLPLQPKPAGGGLVPRRRSRARAAPSAARAWSTATAGATPGS